MQAHNLKRNNPNMKSARVGRGGKRGKTSGRGHKGQKARAGRKLRPEIRDMIKKIPKKRGFKFKSIQVKPETLNLSILDLNFKDGEVVNMKSLLAKGLVEKMKGKNPIVKILAKGEITKKLSFERLSLSEEAKKKITKVGGSVK